MDILGDLKKSGQTCLHHLSLAKCDEIPSGKPFLMLMLPWMFHLSKQQDMNHGHEFKSIYVPHSLKKKNLDNSGDLCHIYTYLPYISMVFPPSHGWKKPHRAAWGRRRLRRRPQRRRLRRSSAGSRPDGATACRKSGGKGFVWGWRLIIVEDLSKLIYIYILWGYRSI